MERFLYRLSVSPYSDRFYLKGGLVLKLLDEKGHRPTMDIDLLGRTSNKTDSLEQVIRDICSVEYREDAITFDPSDLSLRRSQLRGPYEGVSASFSSRLFTSRVPVRLDIGFSDVLGATAQRVVYPTLLPFSAPCLLGYRFETVVAEKLETLVRFDLATTRIKDIFDIWTILHRHEVDPQILSLCVQRTFENRGTRLKRPRLFNMPPTADVRSKWREFLFTLGESALPWEEVVGLLDSRLEFLFSIPNR